MTVTRKESCGSRATAREALAPRSLRSHKSRTRHPGVPSHEPRPTMSERFTDTVARRSALLMSMMATREPVVAFAATGRVLDNTSQLGWLQLLPPPQFGSTVVAALAACTRPASPAHCWLTAITSRLDTIGHTESSCRVSRRSMARMRGADITAHEPKFVRISVKFIEHGTPGLSQWCLAPGGCGAVTPTDNMSGCA